MMAAGKRTEGVGYNEYKAGLKAEERWLKQRVRGVLVWAASRGSYIVPNIQYTVKGKKRPWARARTYKEKYFTLNGSGVLPVRQD